jgi:uncharacterized protein involved in exopolysaccharide biosynthesis
MLQRQTVLEHSPDLDQGGEFISPSHLFDILKRRALYFAIPFLSILAIGSLVTIAWPAKYLSEGKILISSQEIPRDLVRPTVAALSNERIQYIQQRIMTRDNLLAMAKKFNISMGWQGRISGTDLVDFIRSRILIKPLELTLQGERKQAIAFTVGFEYEQPQTATRVANELVTMILDQDVRSRTNFASETTRFLAQEVKRLEDQLNAINVQIKERESSLGGALTDTDNSAKSLASLKAQLVIKTAIYSASHPEIRALKRQIEALEKSPEANAETSQKTGTDADAAKKDGIATNPDNSGLDGLLTTRISIRTDLTNASQKLSAARLGEGLERGQHSERLEVIEQATVPTQPTSPNRPKIFAFVFAFALMAGGGLLVGTEMLNPAVRRSSDLFSLIDSQMIVAIPHIRTFAELKGKKRKHIYTGAIFAAVVLAGLTVIFFILPPLDIVFDRIMAFVLR